MDNQKINNYKAWTSACPVHFLWDGNGSGRRIVRFGFAFIILALSAVCADKLWPNFGLNRFTYGLLQFGVLIWLYGKLRSYIKF
ncbi:MAG: hypothetical protein O2897_02760 [bacterium]|nr:hypothetical protein [bacterium]